jgi:hypothetical protein
MPLSNEQIKHLFAFTEKKSVRYYDLQAELVDHLAERIEEEITAAPQLSFENALAKVYAEFGIFGFGKIVQQKEAEVLKSARTLWFKELFLLFCWPKIILVSAIFMVLYQLSIWLPLQPLKIFAGICWFAFSCVTVIREYKFQKKIKKLLILNDKWIYFPGFAIYCQYLINSVHIKDHIWFSILITLSIIFQLAYIQMHKKIKSKALQLYPEAFITA